MKNIILIILLIATTMPLMMGQNGLKNGVYAHFGYGQSDDSHTIKSFDFGYQREVFKLLFIDISYTDIQGSQSFESVFGEFPITNQYGEFGETYRFNESTPDNIFGRILQIESWSLGIKKYIQMSPKMYIVGGLGVNYNSISEMDIGGLLIASDGTLNYEESYPTFASYHEIGGRVSLESLFQMHDFISISAKAEYLSVSSIITLNLGASFQF